MDKFDILRLEMRMVGEAMDMLDEGSDYYTASVTICRKYNVNKANFDKSFSRYETLLREDQSYRDMEDDYYGG